MGFKSNFHSQQRPGTRAQSVTKPPDLTAEVFLRFFFFCAQPDLNAPRPRGKKAHLQMRREELHGRNGLAVLMGSYVTLGKGGER